MSEELKQAFQVFATDMIQKIQTGVDQGTSFVSSQAPLIMQEIVLRGIILSAVWLAVGAVALFFSAWLTQACIKMAEQDGDSDWYMCAALSGLLLGGGSLAVFLVNLVNLFSCIFAPRLYILEQLKALFLQ